MTITLSRVKGIWPWLIEARFAWLTLGVIGIAFAVSLRPNTPEPVIRLTGLVLQLLGISTVIWGISETRALFGHPSFAAKARSWLKRFPLLQRSIVLAGGVGSSTASSSGGRAYGTYGQGLNPTIETRLDALEKNVSLIHERITGMGAEMDEGFRKANDALKNEEHVRQMEDCVIHQKLEATGTGGVHISAIGASWLFVGVILSTAGIEIAELLK